MKRFAVAILAMVAISGCGVGADEYWDGEKIVSRSGQALENNPDGAPELPGAEGSTAPGAEPGVDGTVPQTPATATPSPWRDPSTVALPQDPIPVFEGKPAPKTPPVLDPGFEGIPALGPRPSLR